MKIALIGKMHRASKARGVGAYTRELVRALTAVYPEDTFSLISDRRVPLGAQLIHYPFFDPFSLDLPVHARLPIIVTIHDMIPLKYPAHFPAGIRGRLKWYLARLRVRRAAAIITDSESSKRDIAAYCHLPPTQIHVVPLAPATARTSYKLTPKIKKTYNLPDRYILYVGDINWNKNLRGLLDVFEQLTLKNVHLVLVGKVFHDRPDIPEYRELAAQIAASRKRAQIHCLGYVPSHHLGAIYHAATVYCQPSWDEGFGLPILEAMKAGCPVVSSARGSLKEVGQDGALYVDPARPAEWLATLTKVLRSPALQAELRARGYLVSKQYSWEKVARATHAIYEDILAQNRKS